MFVRPISFLFFCLATVFPVQEVIASAPICSQSLLKEPMSAKIYYVNQKPILLLAGGIESDSGKVVGPAIRKTRSYTEVWLCSGGGAVVGGKEIGHALNRAKATVRTPDQYFCASACTIAFMGGYVRIIDRDAQFVTHASSSAKGFGVKKQSDRGTLYSPFAFYNCGQPFLKAHCESLRKLMSIIDKDSKYACKTPREVNVLESQCMYFSVNRTRSNDNIFFANALLTNFLYNDPKLVYDSIDIRMKNSVKSEADLLRYFQTMLLDGQAKHINARTYQTITSQFTPTNIYQLPNSDEYHRDFENDYKTLNDAGGKEFATYAIWQTLLTDSELSVKTQLTQFIRRNNLDLGLAGNEAMKMYDAMRTCQIQSSCRLEPHSAFALGYHNIAGTE